MLVVLAEFASRRHAVEFGDADVHEDQVVLAGFHACHRFQAVARKVKVAAKALQTPHADPAVHHIVFDDEHFGPLAPGVACGAGRFF